eukprot:CAMPEP_0198516318 /NCGR_PEP_ID=MMETSP1462-20131121/17842_1 /TAXON_ID=1333877 /ORGANISM="Brandtodinium nutriculum, Strain RCC3387" /LENGTH=146 /DNA_ID=CAMNT_0044245841 /DNA_START=114 /DNA_END=551 /DNA_ORIENTATION=-
MEIYLDLLENAVDQRARPLRGGGSALSWAGAGQDVQADREGLRGLVDDPGEVPLLGLPRQPARAVLREVVRDRAPRLALAALRPVADGNQEAHRTAGRLALQVHAAPAPRLLEGRAALAVGVRLREKHQPGRCRRTAQLEVEARGH